jgi:hypothetical protein
MLQGEFVRIHDKNLIKCSPQIYMNDTVNIDNLYIPCGDLPANVFIDFFSLLSEKASFSEVNISLDIDRNILYKAPNICYLNASHWLLDTGLFPQEQADEHFIVWMRLAAFSPFRKLYAVSKDHLDEGRYTMSIHNLYNVPGVKKYFVQSDIGAFQTVKYGPAIVFGVMAGKIFLAARITQVDWIGWKRMKSTSIFHPNQLKNIFVS